MFVKRNPPIQWPLMSDGKRVTLMIGQRRGGRSDKMTARGVGGGVKQGSDWENLLKIRWRGGGARRGERCEDGGGGAD